MAGGAGKSPQAVRPDKVRSRGLGVGAELAIGGMAALVNLVLAPFATIHAMTLAMEGGGMIDHSAAMCRSAERSDRAFRSACGTLYIGVVALLSKQPILASQILTFWLFFILALTGLLSTCRGYVLIPGGQLHKWARRSA